MSNSEILIGRDPDARLDTGMTVKEAVDRTRKWWGASGRHLMVEKQAHQSKAARSVFASLDPEDANYLPSGIISGLEWDVLTLREKLRLVKFWHHFFVRNPDIIGTPEHEYKFGQTGKIQ